MRRDRVVSVRLNAEESAALDRIGGPNVLRRLIAELVQPPTMCGPAHNWTGVTPFCMHWPDGTSLTYTGSAT